MVATRTPSFVKQDSSSRKSSASTHSSSSNSHHLKSMKRGSVSWDEMVRPFCPDLVFRCLQRNRIFSDATFGSWSGHAAVLFVDLSGYSKITSALADRGAYVLSRIVNDYLSELLRVVQLFGGDVVKFAGDAILVVWEGDAADSLAMNTLCAAQCAVQMQELAGNYPVEGTDLSFRIHCGLCCGSLDTEVFQAPHSAHMQRLYHVVSGDPLIEIGDLVDFAKAGETCVSWGCAEHLKNHAVLQSGGDCGELLVKMNLDEKTDMALDEHIDALRKQREKLRVTKMEEGFIHPSVLNQLQHGGTQVAQMRNLCVIFISKTSSGNSANWLMEVHDVLDRHRCPIVQIIDDDKGVHLTAAVNLHESIPEATTLGLNACRELISKQVGCAIGMAMGGSYCGITGSANIACRWDITGAPVVRAARLMQYAVREGLPIAIDHSVYDAALMSTTMDPHSCVYLKGSKRAATVYVLSPSKSSAASMILECLAFAPIYQEQVTVLQEFLSGEESRGAAFVTGPSLVGKKVICQRAAGLAQIIPILHKGDPTKGLFQIGRTLADWFIHYFDRDCYNGAREVKDHIANHRFSRAHDECLHLINKVVKSGYRGCVVVDRVQDLDQFSMSFIRECLVAHKQRKVSLNSRMSSSFSLSGDEHVEENGKFFFLCAHQPLYSAKTVQSIVKELVRAHHMHVPILEVTGATKEELRVFVRTCIDLDVEDAWLNLYAKTSGYRCGYMFQRIRYLRLVSARRLSEGKTPLSIISKGLKLHVTNGMERYIKVVRVTQVNAETAMRFGRVFDELPPMFQTFVEVVAVATNRCFYHVPITAVTRAMEDLFLHTESEETFPVDVVIAELEDMFILEVDGEGENKRIHLRSPAFADTVLAVCTPLQVETMAAALVERIDECRATKTFTDYLVIAGLSGILGDVATQYEHWKLAYDVFLETSKDMSDRSIRYAKELIEEEIEVGGGDVKSILEVDLYIERPIFEPMNLECMLLKYYSGPITFGPMGHTLSAISRNCFNELRVGHDITDDEVSNLRQDISSSISRYLEQIQTVELYLDEHSFGASPELLAEERNLLQKLLKQTDAGTDCTKKVNVFLNQLLPDHIEPRMHRLRCHVKILRVEKIVPDVIETSEDDAIRLAYAAMQQDCHRNDAIQDALVALASLNWAPKKVPENLPLFYYQTVATIRYRIMRKLSVDEITLFRHQHIVDDLEAFLILAALLPEKDFPRIG